MKCLVPFAAFVLLAAAPLLADPQTAPAPETPRAAAQRVITDVLGVLRDAKLSKPQKADKIGQIAGQNIDFLTLGRLSLGAPYRSLTDTQRTRFNEEFKKHVINTYRHTIEEYTDEDIKITGDRIEPDGDATVLTQIIGTKDSGVRGEVANVDYRLRKKDGQWKIIDVIIDGVSLMANFRSQFQDIVTNSGVDKLINLLHDKNVEAEKNAAAEK